MSGVRTALFVSLAVNLLLVGVVGGAALSNLRQDRATAQSAVARAPNMRSLLDSLPPERAQAIRSDVVKTWREARNERRAARAARVEVYRLAGAEPYDVAAVKAAFARMRAADGEVARRFQDVVADSMAKLTPEERREVLRNLARQRAGRDRRPLIDDVSPAERRLP
jgi:uncharacterized membrane protein